MRPKSQVSSVVLPNIREKLSNFFSKIEDHRWFAGVPRKIIRPAFLGVVLLVLGGLIYFASTLIRNGSNQTAQPTPSLQTAVVRQGSLVVYASGSGTLTASNQVDLSFSTGGQVTGVYVKVGDQVKAGDLLAKVDDTNAQSQYAQARQALLELTSDSAIASAQKAIAQAQAQLLAAQMDLEYLISPDVYYWEEQIQVAERRIKNATDRLNAYPSDVNAQINLKDAQAYLDFVNGKLADAKVAYDKVYVPATFTVHRSTGDYVDAPTDRDIQKDRSAIAIAKLNIQQSQYLYDALTGVSVPPDATGTGLTDLENAKLNLESAQKALDGTRITAPFSGTVMSVNTTVGTMGTGAAITPQAPSTPVGTAAATGAVITLADLSQVYVETFIDPSDWDKVAVGKDAEVTFDNVPNQKYTGKVTEVDSGLYSSGGSSVVRCLVSLDTPLAELNLPIGATASIDVIGGKVDNAILVPITALKKSSSGAYTVFLVENGVPKERTVEIGLQDLLYAEVKSGLSVGDVVVTSIPVTQ